MRTNCHVVHSHHLDMKNCSTSVSADLPDWLRTAYSHSPEATRLSLSKPHHKTGSHSTVSPDAPSSFHNSFVTPLPLLTRSPSPSKFSYEDASAQNYQHKDLSTVRPRHYFDLRNSRNQGLMTQLPYYQAYYHRLNESGFGIHEGFCTVDIRSTHSTLRRKPTPISPMKSVQLNPRANSRYSPKSDLKRSFDSALFVEKTYRVKLPGIRMRRKTRKEVERAKGVMRELDEFDRRRLEDCK